MQLIFVLLLALVIEYVTVDSNSVEGCSDSIYDKVDDTVTLKLEIENGSTEWISQKFVQKSYSLEYLKKEKIVLVDLSELPASEVTKSLLNDVYTLANNLQAEELVVSISSITTEKNAILRNLIVFGFEMMESGKYTSNGEIISLSMEVNQEYDFVDLL